MTVETFTLVAAVAMLTSGVFTLFYLALYDHVTQRERRRFASDDSAV
jgi:hypothetical protein